MKELEEFSLRSQPWRYKTEISKRNNVCKVCVNKLQKENWYNKRWSQLAASLRRRGQAEIDTNELREHLGEPEDTACYICGEEDLTWKTANVDHVIPIIRDGKTELDNLKWAHELCNQMKHTQLLQEMIEMMEKILEYQWDQ